MVNHMQYWSLNTLARLAALVPLCIQLQAVPLNFHWIWMPLTPSAILLTCVMVDDIAAFFQNTKLL